MLVHYGFSPATTGRHLASAALDSGVGYPRPGANRQHLPVELLQACEAYLWVEAGARSYPLDLDRAPVPTAGYLIDVHRHLNLSLLQAALFDVVFIAQRDYLWKIKQVNPNAFWLPLAAPKCFLEMPRRDRFAVGFVGSLSQSAQRKGIVETLNCHFEMNNFRRRYSITEMAEVYSSSRVVVNPPVGGDVNMRFFEAMACGAALVSPPLKNGIEELASEGRHYVTTPFSDLSRIVEVVAELCESGRYQDLGAAARELVRERHTYHHRIRVVAERLESAAADAPIRHMSRARAAGHYLALASVLGDLSLLRHIWPDVRWSGGELAAASRTVGRAVLRPLRGRLPRS
jgi:hypothetical protein